MAARGVVEMISKNSTEDDGEASLLRRTVAPAARYSGRWLDGDRELSGGAEERRSEERNGARITGSGYI
jgi:hypothetical protein